MKDAFIIGYGHVGKATAKALDIPYWFDLKGSTIDLKEGAKKKWCFICLPTPTDEKGGQSAAIDTIRDYIKQIKELGGNCIFVIRSTVLPGTCRALAEMTGAVVCSAPEFLSEATFIEDALRPKMKVFGADKPQYADALAELWKNIPAKFEIKTDTITAEMIKYTFNTFAVTKVVFANQIYDACQVVGANYDKIYHILRYHPWGSKHHLRVFDKGGRGAGGHCLPKDIKAFAKMFNSRLLELVSELNENYLIESKKD
jgi:nucleotide sugar dehydrogenase